MKLIQIDHNPSRKQLNVFGVLWLVFFTVIGGLVLNKSGSAQVATFIWVIAAVVPLVGWVVPALMRYAYLGMAYATYPIGFVISHLILAIVYYLAITPIGLIMRLFGYDPMSRHFDKNANTYWCERKQDDKLDTYFRQF